MLSLSSALRGLNTGGCSMESRLTRVSLGIMVGWFSFGLLVAGLLVVFLSWGVCLQFTFVDLVASVLSIPHHLLFSFSIPMWIAYSCLGSPCLAPGGRASSLGLLWLALTCAGLPFSLVPPSLDRPFSVEENKLFIEYHDIHLPFLNRINALHGRKAYATRTLFFLTPLGTLKPIAIELSLPPEGPNSRSKRVVTSPVDETSSWIWQLAKAHVCSNDASVHQLVHHWLRTHASLEPFILAAQRQLSAMHPVFILLDPHMRYTLEINALARQNLINGDGVIEACFTPGQYSMEISAAAYKNFWRFDKESLYTDLIRRYV
ncbi:hypothetical protein SADUNF_Sadunf03G0040900 [Salix dunnii]|uniref:Lipoxygenase domain-containing protein n=1 Tax=Salix dunnii TaxID=1413687 RepID=A0A835K6Y4_9ROSI|nr:hypothetical protein SADUNF_Sadunf03G0040900 [Salix dunnii]